MKCTKVIIPVAGYGTRRLPITKVVEKCMLPILNRPIIDYIVEDCIKAGVTDIYFVVSRGSTQLREYYEHNERLEAYLRQEGKEAALASIAPPSVNLHYIEQDNSPGAKLGSAIPVWLCREYIEPDEHVLVLMGDDFIYNQDGSSETARLVAEAAAKNGSAMLGVEVPQDAVSHYGVIAQHEVNGHLQFDEIQEKPSVEAAKSNLINVSKYVFAASFFAYLDHCIEQEQTGEYYITDAINAFVADGNPLFVVPAQGKYLDGGVVDNWLAANNYVAEHPQKSGTTSSKRV